jgi:hypothetical protein
MRICGRPRAVVVGRGRACPPCIATAGLACLRIGSRSIIVLALGGVYQGLVGTTKLYGIISPRNIVPQGPENRKLTS